MCLQGQGPLMQTQVLAMPSMYIRKYRGDYFTVTDSPSDSFIQTRFLMVPSWAVGATCLLLLTNPSTVIT